MAAFVVMMLLVVLPLALSIRLGLCAVLGVILVVLWRRRATTPARRTLYIDTDKQTISAGDEQLLTEPINCRVTYHSARMLMLTYEYRASHHHLPIFHTLLSEEDYSRLLAVARSMSALPQGDH